MTESSVILPVGRQDAMPVMSLRKHPSALTPPHRKQLVSASRKAIEQQQQDVSLRCMVHQESGIVQDGGTCGCSGVLRAASR